MRDPLIDVMGRHEGKENLGCRPSSRTLSNRKMPNHITATRLSQVNPAPLHTIIPESLHGGWFICIHTERTDLVTGAYSSRHFSKPLLRRNGADVSGPAREVGTSLGNVIQRACGPIFGQPGHGDESNLSSPLRQQAGYSSIGAAWHC